MNVDKEIAAAQRRIRAQINASAQLALDRIEEPTPTEMRLGITRQARAAVRVSNQAFAIGQAYGEMARALQKAAEDMAAGFAHAMGGRRD